MPKLMMSAINTYRAVPRYLNGTWRGETRSGGIQKAK